MSDQNKVVKFKKRKSMSVGVVVFFVLFLYIVIKVGIYLTKEQMTIYEVLDGSTAIDNRVTGIILRQEELINSSKAGYIISYQRDCSRVAKDAPLFSINNTLLYDADMKPKAFSERDIAQIKHEIRSYMGNDNNSDFEAIYDFKDNIKSTVMEIQNNNLVISGEQVTGENSVMNNAVRSAKSGIITYYQDGYESVKPDQVTEDMFNKEKYKRVNLRTTEKINQNSPVCKIVNSEVWNLVLKLSNSQYKRLKDQKNINVTIVENGIKLSSEIQFINKGSQYFGVLTLNKNMSDYLTERYLDVELNFSSEDGLKIPLSSLVNKDFYEVPKSFFSKGGDSNKLGVIKVDYTKNGDIKYSSVPTDIYYKTDKFYYIDTNIFPPGTKIQSKDDNKQYTLSKTLKLTGVYNVNQGYAVFRRIEIISQDSEYCIVKKNTENGLSAYDHIALNSKMAVEQKIIY